MASKFEPLSIIIIGFCVLILSLGGCAQTAAQKPAQPTPQVSPQPAAKAAPQASSASAEDLRNQPAQLAVFVMFLNKYGYKAYATKSGEEEQIISYKVKDPKNSEMLSYAIIYFPKSHLLRFEAYNLADVPTDKNKLNLLYEKMAELNSKRTTGKFCLDGEKKKVRYTYYRTVLGGICYADFKTTLAMIEFIVVNDLKEIKELKS